MVLLEVHQLHPPPAALPGEEGDGRADPPSEAGALEISQEIPQLPLVDERRERVQDWLTRRLGEWAADVRVSAEAERGPRGVQYRV